MKGITDAQRSALERITPALEPGTYLAGGVAVATLLGHRLSLDIDLFVPSDFNADALEERLVAEGSDIRITGRASGTLHLEVAGVPTSVLRYRYPLLGAPRRRGGLPVVVATAEDLACMKLSAIAGRGAAKDFWDLNALLDNGVAGADLANLLTRYRTKFAAADVGHVVKSLAYFGDADAAPLPSGLTAPAWNAIKKAFRSRVRALGP